MLWHRLYDHWRYSLQSIDMTPQGNEQVMTSFAAIDFETADNGRDSACAIGAVRVWNGRITEKYHQLIRPPRAEFLHTPIHGLAWEDVCNSPTFGAMWPELRDFIAGAKFLVAHNAPFDRSVLYQCCEAAGIEPPDHEFRCTLQMARAKWNLPSSSLRSVCGHLGIPLNHHEALSDAEACARIAIAAMRARSS